MSELDPRLGQALDALRRESAAPPRPEAMQTARAAMHQAVAERPPRRGLALLADRWGAALTAHRLMAGGAAAAAALAVVAVAGWNAPAGSPLHGVRVAHEQLSLVLPGSDRAGLDLDFAEARLRQARDDRSVAALDEARSLLDDARAHLAAGSSLWSRWQADESVLDKLRDGGEGGPGVGGSDDGAGSPAGGGASGGSGAGGSTTSGSGGHGGGSSSPTASGSEDGGSSGQGSSSSTSSSGQSSSTSSGGGGSSSSTSTSSSSDGGGGGGGDGGSGGSTTSTSSTSSTSSSSGGGSGGSDG